jgi:hypothetical protein
MPFTFKIEPPPEYLSMVYEGTYKPSLADQFTDQVLEVCLKHQPTKLLIDLRQVQGGMNTMDRFVVATFAATKYIGARITGKIPGCRYAIVGNPPLVDSHKFEETVAVNRGIAVKVTTEMKEAIHWLAME